MPKGKLLPQTLTKLKPGKDGHRVSYYDTDKPGLLLRVGGPEPKDRVYYFEYSIRGRSRRMRLGDLADDKTLSDRRNEVARLRGLVSSGADPLEEREKARAVEEGAETFAELGERALNVFDKQLRTKTMTEWKRMWAKHLVPAMGSVDAGDPMAVKRTALKMSDKLLAAGNGYGANRCLGLACRIMSFAVAKDRDGRYPANPLLRLPKPHRETVRTRVYTADEVRVIVACAAGTLYEDVIPLLLATGARAGEALAAEWREIDGTTWTIPAAKSKIKHDRPVHLNRYALATLERIRERSGGSFLFPAPTKSGHRERMQKEVYAVRREPPNDTTPWVSGVVDFELHDLRRVVRAGLSDLGTRTDIAELALGHLPPKLVRIYSPHPSFWRLREQRGAMDAWGARLERLLAGEPEGATVLAFPAAGASS